LDLHTTSGNGCHFLRRERVSLRETCDSYRATFCAPAASHDGSARRREQIAAGLQEMAASERSLDASMRQIDEKSARVAAGKRTK
jgi:hypothetical protein